MNNKKIPKATVQRYPLYLKALRKLKADGQTKVMSNELASLVSIEPTTIRRDFSFLGTLGKQGFGYDIEKLIQTFSDEVGMNIHEKIIIVGMGNLGKALLNYNQWEHTVGEIVCAFDLEPNNVSSVSIPVYNLKDLKEKLPKECRIAILCITENVQNTVDLLIDCGIKGFVNFATDHFTVPQGIYVKNVDIISSIQELVLSTTKGSI